jgi:hypothetical protein
MGRIAKILGLIAIVALLLGSGALFTVVAQGETVVSIDAPAEATADSDFTANVAISDVTDFDACQYDVTFDATVLRLDNVTSGLIGSTTVPVDLYNELSAGTFRVIQNVPGLSGVTGSGYLAVLHFHVIGSEGESSDIDLSNGVLSDITASQIPATWVGDTVMVSDFTAPTVDSTSPPNGATDVLVDTVVTATFSEAMDESTITTSSFTIAGVSGSVSYNSGSYTATFTPAADLAYDTTYTASLSTAITDAAGNPLASTYSWSFTTGSLPPGTSLVSIDAPAEVMTDEDFTANVNISSVTDFDACQYDVTFDPLVLRLDDVTSGLIGSTTVPVDIYNELSAGTFRVIQNVPGLTGATGSGYLAVLHFHVIGAEGSGSDIDLSNGVLSDITASQIPAVWSGDSVTVGGDTTPPTVVSRTPASGATGVAVDTVVTATFSEAMNASTITTSSFTLRRGATPVSGSVSYNSGSYTATFDPAADLAYDTTYTASLSTAITDAAGNPLASTYSWSFTTGSEPGVVTVSIDAPASVAPDSDFTANVTISSVTDFDACQYDVTFDATVLRLDDVTSGLIGSTTIPVDIYNELSAGTFRVIQNVPGLTGATGSGYLAVLHFHAIGSEGEGSDIDLSNGVLSNTQAEAIEAVWTGDTVTIADTVPPTVVSTSPAADATDVLVDTVVTATFSEAMDESTITTSSFTIAGVVGSVSYNAGSYTATFTPTINLAYDTTYTASLSTVITDAAGNPLASTYSWSFTTESVPPGMVVVSIDAPSGPRVNSDFTANVNISDVTDFDACQYDVSFDPLVLRLDDVTAGEIDSIEIPVDIYNELSAGTFRVVQNVPGLTGATGSGYLAVLHFYVIGSVGDVSVIGLSNGTLSSILAEAIPAVWVGDMVTIARQSGGGGGGGGGGGAPPDTTPPVISNVGVSSVTKTSADVAWTTNEKSDSQVEFWASPGVVTPLDTALVIQHNIHLDELTPGSNYYFKVRSSDEAGNMAESEEHTFTTLPGESAFTTAQLSVSPGKVYVGETVTISVLVTNNGDAAGSYTLRFKVDGLVEETRDVALDAGASEEVTFTTVKDVAGTYSVEVGGLSGSFTVIEKPEEPTTPPEIPEEKPTINWPIIWGTMAGVLVVGVIILWIAIRRRAY